MDLPNVMDWFHYFNLIKFKNVRQHEDGQIWGVLDGREISNWRNEKRENEIEGG